MIMENSNKKLKAHCLIMKKILVLFLLGICIVPGKGQVTRKPYLQVMTPGSVMVRWNTTDSIYGKVYYGQDHVLLTDSSLSTELTTFHKVTLSGLSPSTKYFYSIEGQTGTEDKFFISSPPYGAKENTRIWVISDFGQGPNNKLREKTIATWKEFNNDSYYADFVLSLGDHSNNDEQEELQPRFFDILENIISNSPLFAIVGNHDGPNFFQSFSMPTKAEAGGKPSLSPHYFSFNYGNIHIIVLSAESGSGGVNGSAQLNWLRNDLINIDKAKTDWIIACMHRPCHSSGSHESDDNWVCQNQRTYWLTDLENYGVDLILSGHNHIYERSVLVDNIIGPSYTVLEENFINDGLGRFDKDSAYVKPPGLLPHKGTVFVNVTSGGKARDSFNQPKSFIPIVVRGSSGYEGSLVIDTKGADRLDVYFLCNQMNINGNHIWDYFTILKKDVTNSIDKDNITLSSDPYYLENFPNPFRYSTVFSFNFPHKGNIFLDIFDLFGKKIMECQKSIQGNDLKFDWEPKDESGNMLPAGMYIARLRAGNITRSTKMLVY